MPVTTDVACAHAGLLAAAGIVASKQIAVRNPPLPGPRQVRPSSLGDLARLFGREEKTVTGRVARLSAAALVYSANKDAVQAEKILREEELKILDTIDGKTQAHKNTDRSCPHCRLLYGSLYEDQERWRNFRRLPLSTIPPASTCTSIPRRIPPRPQSSGFRSSFHMQS